ncbi:MAG TPA: OmpH family outer membrane protein [Thermoanaerobaculia bacterium]|nr:OmpH family outer membrane protein [Thermoanaerobaculia bacterium]
MKLWTIVVMAGAAALPAAAQTAVPKIAVIDVQKLVVESAAGKEAQGRVKKVIDAKQGDADKLQKELQSIQQRLTDQGPSMTDDKRDQLNKEYQEKGIAYKRFQDDAQREVQEAQQRELGELEKRVMPVINQVGKEKGYTLIFNKYAPGMLVYADDSVDITEEVLRRFNTQVTAPPAKVPATAPAPGTKPAAPPKPPAAKTPPPPPGASH